MHVGPSLMDLYPVKCLQPGHFSSLRRGLSDYLDDLDALSISYRRYDFTSGGALLLKERYPLDERHRGEYSYHVMKYLVVNYAKLMARSNLSFDDDHLLDQWRRHLPSCVDAIPFYECLAKEKSSRGSDFPGDSAKQARPFR